MFRKTASIDDALFTVEAVRRHWEDYLHHLVRIVEVGAGWSNYGNLRWRTKPAIVVPIITDC